METIGQILCFDCFSKISQLYFFAFCLEPGNHLYEIRIKLFRGIFTYGPGLAEWHEGSNDNGGPGTLFPDCFEQVFETYGGGFPVDRICRIAIITIDTDVVAPGEQEDDVGL